MLGLRFTFLQPHQRTWPTDGTIDWLWPAAERAGLPIALLAGDFLPLVGQVAERHPRLKLIIDHLGRPSDTQGRRRLGEPAGDAGAGQAPERRHQGHRRAELLQRGVSLPQHPRPPAPDLRRLRPGADVLGHRHHAHAVLVAAVRDDVHRGAALAVGARQGAGDGARPVRLARLEDAGDEAGGARALRPAGRGRALHRGARTSARPAPARSSSTSSPFPINPADISMCRGSYRLRPTLPATPGAECIGRVTAVGAGVSHVKPGDLVINLQRENWAQKRRVKGDDVIAVPPGIDILQGAMLRINPPTALLLLSDVVDLKPGDWVIQNVANSAVGRLRDPPGPGARHQDRERGAARVAVRRAEGARRRRLRRRRPGARRDA